MARSHGLGSYRLGATSYVIPADILPNVEYLAPLVDDVELVLFETDEHGSNLPDPPLRARLLALAQEHDLTYTVHLPLDLRLGDDGEEGHLSLVKARRVIEATRELDPYAFTLHLDGSILMGQPSSEIVARWQERSVRALRLVAEWLGGPERLAVENVEAWDPELFGPVVEQAGVSRVIDVGHLWLQEVDPLDHLERWVDRARVIHLHGLARRDHSSLAGCPAEKLDPVVAFLSERFRGVLTLEVFNEGDLRGSLDALSASRRRIGEG